MQPGDLPAGWTASAARSDHDTGAARAAATANARCLGVRSTYPDLMATGRSPNYTMASLFVGSAAWAYRDEDDITVSVRSLSLAKASTCFAQSVKTELERSVPGHRFGDVHVTVTPGSDGGPGNVVGIATGTLSDTFSGHEYTVNIQNAFIIGPRIKAEVEFSGVDAVVPLALRAQIIEQVASRVRAG